ncbi:hypothetical protein ACIP5Y_43030 [Nocardia sp. NPDC088792]|uniref:hypothetical protein n=1 Tax=Nocardia sp. NPDC088792 TaxID=3364332 RepID=UPI00381CF5F4
MVLAHPRRRSAISHPGSSTIPTLHQEPIMTDPLTHNPPADPPKPPVTQFFNRLPAWHAEPSTHAPLSDSCIELLLEAHGDNCERAGCELRRYLQKLQRLAHPADTHSTDERAEIDAAFGEDRLDG